MRGIFVDIENELADIENEVDMLSRSVELYGHRADDGDPAWGAAPFPSIVFLPTIAIFTPIILV
jgi:hypothetical protein